MGRKLWRGLRTHRWAHVGANEGRPKKNVALCKKAMSPFWMYDESVPTNWWTEVFLEARASLIQGGHSPTGFPTGSPTSSQIGFPTGPPTGRPSITFGSLFTGIGAGHEALRGVPHQWIFAVECDRYCCDVLRQLPTGPSLLLQQKVETVDMDMLPPVASFRIALGGNSRRESALPFRGPRKIGPAVPTLTFGPTSTPKP